MKYLSFVIAACVSTIHGVERLADNGNTLDAASTIDDRTDDKIFWSLYGYLEDGKCECISDFASQEIAISTYENLTGLSVVRDPSQVHFSLDGPGATVPASIAAGLAEQIEQMRGMFDDKDGALANALDAYYEHA